MGIKKAVANWREETKEMRLKEIIGGALQVNEVKWIIMITYMREKRMENWEAIQKLTEEFPEYKIIIGGDFNAKTAEKGGAGYEDERKRR